MTDSPEGFRQWRFAPPPGATTLLLVRHGESQAAHPDRPFPLADGHGDPPLHPEGELQAEALAARIEDEQRAGWGPDAIYVTSLRRTQQTAAPTAARLGLPTSTEADLREVHLGEWEGGLLRQKAAAGDPLLARMATEERWDVIPGAEPLETFEARLVAGVGRIAAAHPDQRVMVVTHGGVIGHLLHRATGAGRFAFSGADNASISELVVLPGRWMLRRFNDTAHLSPSAR